MSKTKDVFNKAEQPLEWLVRAVIIGLLAWAGLTLVSVDKTVNLFDYRLTQLEHFHHPHGE